MNILIREAEDFLCDYVLAFCNNHFLNYQGYFEEGSKFATIKINHVDKDTSLSLLNKIIKEYDRYDYRVIEIS